MYYRESDILLRMNPEYERYIIKLDEIIGSMGKNKGGQLKLDILSDITDIKSEIIKYIFDYYCSEGILTIKKYLFCPYESVNLNEIDDIDIGRFPLIKFCDVCGTEHTFTNDEITVCYELAGCGNSSTRDKCNSVGQTQLLNGEKDPGEGIIDANLASIELKEFSISSDIKDIVKIAVVQLNFRLSETFPFQVMDKISTKKKLERALEKATNSNVDIICFPELCFCEEWVKDFELSYPNISIIPGTYYDNDNHNRCKLLIGHNGTVPDQMKIIPSESEIPIIAGIGMVSGDKIYIYETKLGKISVLICRDFGNFIDKLSDKIDIVFVPSYNCTPERFEETANNFVTNHPSYIIISNCASFGGTSIFGQMDKVYFNQLVQAGYKEKDSEIYKICEIKRGFEGIIMAKFNIKYKSIQKPTPINPNEVMRSVTNIERIDL